jgi:hypothetical protein
VKLTIVEILKSVWYAGMLMDAFRFDNGATGTTHSILYRVGMEHSLTVTIKGVGRRGFALAGMPVSWVAKVGDVIEIHPSQL